MNAELNPYVILTMTKCPSIFPSGNFDNNTIMIDLEELHRKILIVLDEEKNKGYFKSVRYRDPDSEINRIFVWENKEYSDLLYNSGKTKKKVEEESTTFYTDKVLSRNNSLKIKQNLKKKKKDFKNCLRLTHQEKSKISIAIFCTGALNISGVKTEEQYTESIDNLINLLKKTEISFRSVLYRRKIGDFKTIKESKNMIHFFQDRISKNTGIMRSYHVNQKYLYELYSIRIDSSFLEDNELKIYNRDYTSMYSPMVTIYDSKNYRSDTIYQCLISLEECLNNEDIIREFNIIPEKDIHCRLDQIYLEKSNFRLIFYQNKKISITNCKTRADIDEGYDFLKKLFIEIKSRYIKILNKS